MDRKQEKMGQYRAASLSGTDGSYWHPWLRMERALRTILAVRLERRSDHDVDRTLMSVVAARERVERAGWFN